MKNRGFVSNLNTLTPSLQHTELGTEFGPESSFENVYLFPSVSAAAVNIYACYEEYFKTQ